MKFGVLFVGHIAAAPDGGPLPPEEIEARLDEILEILENSGDAEDATVRATLSTGTVEVTVGVTVEGPDDEEEKFGQAAKFGSSIIRSAIHGAGVGTPGWSIHWVRVTTEKSNVAPSGDLITA